MEQDFETFEEEQEVAVVPEDAEQETAAAPEGEEQEVAAASEDEAQEVAAAPEDEAQEVTATPVSTSFGTVTDRLSEIAEVMEDETMPLDDALDLLEEAVTLGMQASNLLESDMEAHNAEEEDEETEAESGEGAE